MASYNEQVDNNVNECNAILMRNGVEKMKMSSFLYIMSLKVVIGVTFGIFDCMKLE